MGSPKVKETPEPNHSDASKYIVPFNVGSPAKPPIYLVHPLMGDVRSFAALPKFLAPEQPFFGIQMPKELRTGSTARSIEEMAATYVRALFF